MDSLGINLGFLEIQLPALGLCVPFLLSLSALFSLRRRSMVGAAPGLWGLIICAIPYLGALAYWIIRPQGNESRGG
jgi:hypothetical protein